jgi:hypothetical protein
MSVKLSSASVLAGPDQIRNRQEGLQPTLDTGTQALITAALAWLASAPPSGE